jgi:hypothetical protein
MLVLLVSAVPVLAEPIRPTGKPLQVRQNEVAEWQGQSTGVRDDPFNEVTGSCAVPRGPINRDWVLVLKPEKEETDK